MMRIAIIADVHGNLLALDAVLADVERRGGAGLLVNLGDCVSGPLWPAETAARLMALDAVTVRGNHDRAVGTMRPEAMGPSDRHAVEALNPAQREWLAALPLRAQPVSGVLAFHATPAHDETYLVEEVADGRLRRGPADAAAARLGDIGGNRVALCGHSHIAHLTRLGDGVLIVNPGSVGCPAYEDPSAPAHVSESGSPCARYAVIDWAAGNEPSVAFHAIPYDHEAAARRAEANGRADWARALRTGFMS